MVGILLSYWGCLFSGAMLVSGRVIGFYWANSLNVSLNLSCWFRNAELLYSGFSSKPYTHSYLVDWPRIRHVYWKKSVVEVYAISNAPNNYITEVRLTFTHHKKNSSPKKHPDHIHSMVVFGSPKMVVGSI